MSPIGCVPFGFSLRRRVVGLRKTGSISVRPGTGNFPLFGDVPRRRVPALFRIPGYSRHIGIFCSLQHSLG